MIEPEKGGTRIVIEEVKPEIDGGRFPAKKAEAKQDVSVDLLEGAQLIKDASQRATKRDKQTMQGWVALMRSDQKPRSTRTRLALSKKMSAFMDKYPERRLATTYDKELVVAVDREKARFSTWYEMFPCSCAKEPGRHATFEDCEARLPYISDMGFDVLYFPPIHPIGHTSRKGKNNTPKAKSGDPRYSLGYRLRRRGA
jgi:starch synthase (maltosyl-transferring)